MFLTECYTLLDICEIAPVVSILVIVEDRQVRKQKNNGSLLSLQEVKRYTEETGRRPNLLQATNCFLMFAQCAKPLQELSDSFDNSCVAA